ncbi:hypothetical protein Ahy_A02g009641 isoform A [Arachis hypogaea]|uniref:K-box domain-containing protein n=1 Tax=Arachis hypogaea TaxID=3818 RepID=A0A445EHP9_ARAHY|nr:hypothetical protein Ahy_A02g009641 isoform A [Arachis hypogaea]
MAVKDLKNLETKLERGISKINELLFAEIDYMQKRIIWLSNEKKNSPSPNLVDYKEKITYICGVWYERVKLYKITRKESQQIL